MVNVIVKYSNNVVCGLEISGHALFDDSGQDIVCAGISSVAFGLLNAFSELHHETKCIVRDNLISIDTKQTDDVSTLIYKVGLIQLQTIKEEFPNYLSIKNRR